MQASPPAVPTAAGLAGSRHSWLLVSVELLLFMAVFVVLWPTTQSLLAEWADTNKTTYTHGHFIAAISVWLLLRNRSSLQAMPVRPSIAAGLLLALASVLWLAVLRSGLQMAHQLLLPGMIWLAVYTVLGARAAFGSAVAIGYLYFAIPVWDEVNFLLQSATVEAVDLMLRVTAIPAYVQGNMVHLAAGSFEIAGGCSGLHFFIVGLALGVLYGEIHRDSWRVRLQLIALVLLLALLTNWLRVYIIIVAGYLTDMQHYLVRVEHYRFGWLVFAVMMFGFFLIARRLPAAVEATNTSQPDARVTAPTGRLSLAVALSLVALIVGPLWNSLDPVTPAAIPASGAVLPSNPGDWVGPRSVNDNHWAPAFAGADLEQRGRYTRGDAQVDAYVAIYAAQAQNKELVRYDNSVVGSERASVISTARITSRIRPRGPVTQLVVETPRGEQSVLWYFYQIDSLQTTRGIVAQLWYGLSSVTGSPVSRVVALRSPCLPDCDAARAELQDLTDSSNFNALP